MLEHRTPLAQLSRANELSAIDATGMRVAAVGNRGFVLVQGDPEDPLLHRAMREQIGVAVPGPQCASIGGEYVLLWMAPGQWLLESPAARAASVQVALVARLGAAFAVVSDVSDAFACFDVSGDVALDVLMTGCSLDLRPDAFSDGRVARSAFAGVPVIICLVDRGFAEHVWSWLANTR